MISGDRTDANIDLYGHNSPKYECPTTQMCPLIIVTFCDLTLTLAVASYEPYTHAVPSPYLWEYIWPSLGQDKLNAASPGPKRGNTAF